MSIEHKDLIAFLILTPEGILLVSTKKTKLSARFRSRVELYRPVNAIASAHSPSSPALPRTYPSRLIDPESLLASPFHTSHALLDTAVALSPFVGDSQSDHWIAA